jgi:O-antigen/teichoic acid export membrane protein
MGVSSFIVTTLFLLKKIFNNKKAYHYLSFSLIKNNLISKWIRYGSPLSLWFAIGLALPFLDRFFINRFLSTESLGIYSGVQEILTKVFSLIIFPLILAIHPRIMNYWNDSKKTDAIQIIKWGLGIMFILALILLYSIWHLDSFIYIVINRVIPQFTVEHQILIIPLLLAGFLWQVSFLTHKMLELKEQTYLMVIFLLISLIINITGNIYFTPRYGIIAIANISLISAFVYCLLTGTYSIYLIYVKKVLL